MARLDTLPLRFHKPSKQAYVLLNGRRVYLGRYGLPETKKNYERFMSEWYANGCQAPKPLASIPVEELALRYLNHCRTYYRLPDGTEGDGVYAVALALRPLNNIYGETPAASFGPLALRAVREKWIADGLRRTTINKRTGVIKRMFRFGVEFQLVPPSVAHALDCVANLHKGRSAAKESRIVTPVPDAHIEAVKPYVSRQVWGLIRLQLLTGARSGEILELRRVDIDTSGAIWTSRVERHKTTHRGKDRMLYFGPRAQAVLREFFIGKGPTDYLFSAADAERERNAARHEGAECPRRPEQIPSIPKTDRAVGECYTSRSYCRAIARACELAIAAAKAAGKPAPAAWHPHRLRHTAATRVRKEAGIEAAAVWLGHSDANVTQVYAEVDHARALEIAGRMG